MWVDKYKPKSTQDLLGQSQNASKIKQWLKHFDSSRSRPLFIYGPPGIGKTTAAHLCCQEMGYKTVEFNASDQRNKNVIKEVISTVAGNSRLDFFGRASETKDAIILDEIDGMAGNEDRGGIGQLIIELKHAKKPMIFICNDGQNQKLRSLKEKCDIIEFKRPDCEAIRRLVTKVATQERLKVDKIDIQNLADASDYDLRQILNSLSLFKDGDLSQISKTTRLNAFEATKKALTAAGQPLSIRSRFECFFADYNIMSLFMFENYLKSPPARGNHLRAVSRAADSFCLSDLAEKEIRTNQNWSLLNTQALLSTVIPSKLVESRVFNRVEFPQFLGKLSNANKRLRMTQELNSHMCLSLRGGLDMDYLEAFRERLATPLLKDKTAGIDAVLDLMNSYSLLRDDLNSIMELASWSFKPDPMTKIDSKTKLALTLAYKKRAVALPYFSDTSGKVAKKRKATGIDGDDIGDDDGDEDEEEEMAVKPKRVVKKVANAKKSAAATKKAEPAKKAEPTTKTEPAPAVTKKTEPVSKAQPVKRQKPSETNGKSNGAPVVPANGGIKKFFK